MTGDVSRQQLIWLAGWILIVAIRGYLLFRRPERRTAGRAWLFGGFAFVGALVVLSLASVWVSLHPPLRGNR